MLRKTIKFSLITFIIIFMSGCTSLSDDPSILSWNLGSEPESIDPAFNSTLDGGTVIRHLYEGLVRESDGIASPGIAKSWEISDNGLKITFKLRKSKWSDGTPLTAHDFIYAWKRCIDPANASTYSWIWEYTNIRGAYEASLGNANIEDIGFSAPNDYTLILELTKPTEYLISLLSLYHFMPVNQKAVDSISEKNWTLDSLIHVSNGPYVLSDYKIGDRVVIRKNNNYWNEKKVNIDQMELLFIDNESTAYLAYQNNELMAIPSVPSDEVPKLISIDDSLHFFTILGTYYYNFNFDIDVLKDVRIRQAINLAIDREKLTDLLGSEQEPAWSFVPPGFPDNTGADYHDDYPVDKIEFDVEKAKQLLTQAGFPDGKGFPQLELSYNTSENHQKIAEIVQEMLKKNLGINIKLTNMEWAVFVTNKKEGNFEVARGSWVSDFVDPISMLAIFASDDTSSSSSYKNSEFNTYLNQAKDSIGSEHFANLSKAESLLTKDYAVIPIYHYNSYWLINDTVEGWNHSIMGFIDFSFATIEE